MTHWERLGGLTVRKFDWVDHLRDDEDIAVYLEAAYEWGNSEFIDTCLSEVARAYGKSELRRSTGSVYETLGDAVAALDTPPAARILQLLGEFDLRLQPVPSSRRLTSSSD